MSKGGGRMFNLSEFLEGPKAKFQAHLNGLTRKGVMVLVNNADGTYGGVYFLTKEFSVTAIKIQGDQAFFVVRTDPVAGSAKDDMVIEATEANLTDQGFTIVGKNHVWACTHNLNAYNRKLLGIPD